MARILVVEDEADLREILQYNLTREGHKVVLAKSGAEALTLAREAHPEVILLDLMLPDVSGTAVCKTLRKEPAGRDARIIMVTARGEEIDRVVGFELGADDYVVKPFSVRELILRIGAVLRRREPATLERVEFGDLALDLAAHRAWVRGAEVALTALEFKLIVVLFERKNRVQTREALLSDVWGIDADITTRTVDTHVKRLRQKLRTAGAYVETVRGVGYRFTDEPTEDQEPA